MANRELRARLHTFFLKARVPGKPVRVSTNAERAPELQTSPRTTGTLNCPKADRASPARMVSATAETKVRANAASTRNVRLHNSKAQTVVATSDSMPTVVMKLAHEGSIRTTLPIDRAPSKSPHRC